MTDSPRVPHAYLLRLRPASSAGTRVWRASLANVQTSERIGFADLASLVAFLEAQTGAHVRPDERPPSTVP
jgi:hypothetical protein